MPETTTASKISALAGDLDTRLQQAWEPIKKVLTFSLGDDLIMPEQNLAVAIEKGRLSVAYGSRFLSRVAVKGTKEYPFGEDKYPQPENLASSLSVAAKEFGTSTTDVTLSIPKAWTVVKTAEFPSAVRENLPAVVSYELDRLTPFAPDEAFFDFRVIKDTGERLTLIVMAAKAETLAPYLSSLREHGFHVSRITTNLAATGALCRYMSAKPENIYLEIQAKGYDGAFFSDGSLEHVFSEIFTSEDEKTRAAQVSSEIRSFMSSAKSSGRAPELTIILKDVTTTFREQLRQRIETPHRILEDSDVRRHFNGVGNGIPHAALGAAVESLWLKAHGLDLGKKGIYAEHKTPIALTLILVFALASMAALYAFKPLAIEKRRLSEISLQIPSKKAEAGKVEELIKTADGIRAELDMINSFKEARTMTLTILKEVTAVLPKSSWLSRIRVTDATVEIEGYAGSATELLPKLEASRYFRKVEFASPTIKDVKMNADRFSIKMEIDTIPKGTDKNPKQEEKTKNGKK